MRLLLLTIAFIISLPSHSSTTPEKRIYHISFLKGKTPTIDGIISDSAWTELPWQGNFKQQKPIEGGIPSKKTLIKILHDENSIYAAIFCYDEPEAIRSIFTKRDNFGGDIVGIAFDSYFNQRTAYEFNVTAAGQKIDLMHTGEGNIDFNWNSNWEAATTVTDSGWSAEFRIPVSQLRYNRQDDHTWGFFVWRWIDRNNEEVQWVLLPVNGPHGVHNFGQIDGISGIRTSRQTEFLPYVSTKLENDAGNDNPYLPNHTITPNAGLDMKIGISSNFTLDATINPDFGQVEADPSELNLSAFETFFQEKRPFFLEGRDIFNFNMEGSQLFYSRRIGSNPSYSPDTEDEEYFKAPQNTTILGSAKITGRTTNNLSVGILETVTNNEFGILYSPVDSGMVEPHTRDRVMIEPLTNYFAGRIKKVSQNTNTIVGGSFNSVIRDLNNPVMEEEFIRTANTAGLDLIQYFSNKNYLLSVKTMASNLTGSEKAITKKQESHIHRFQRPDASHLTLDTTRTSLSGSSGFIGFEKNGGKFLFEINGSYWSPGLNINDIGFMAQTDYFENENEVSYRQNTPGKTFREYRINFENTNRWTFGNERTETTLEVQYNGTFHNLWSVFIEYQYIFNSFDVRSLRGGPALYRDGYHGGGVWSQTNRAKRLYFELYYFNFIKQLNSSFHKSLGGSINANPIDKLRLSLDGHWERNNFANEFFDADLADQDIYMIGRMHQQTLKFTVRAEYYITPEISFQYYGNPFFSAVKYTDLRRTKDSRASNPDQRFHQLEGTGQLQYDANENKYYVNEINGTNYNFDNPDVSFGEFNSNFVFRWEYKLGSLLYFVWSHNQNEDTNIKSPHLNNPVNNLFKAPPGDAFMIKLSYWFNV